MDGEDVMEVEVYKERREHWKRGSEKEKRNRKKNIGRREWIVLLFMQTQSSREHLCKAWDSFASEYKPDSSL